MKIKYLIVTTLALFTLAGCTQKNTSLKNNIESIKEQGVKYEHSIKF